VLLGTGEKLLVAGGLEDVVGLHDGDPGPACHAHAPVAGGAVALVGLVDHQDARVARGVRVREGARAVGRAVVHADDLESLVRLGLDAAQALVEGLLDVVDGDDDRDQVPFDLCVVGAHAASLRMRVRFGRTLY
jgi:hypothetical protein